MMLEHARAMASDFVASWIEVKDDREARWARLQHLSNLARTAFDPPECIDPSRHVETIVNIFHQLLGHPMHLLSLVKGLNEESTLDIDTLTSCHREFLNQVMLQPMAAASAHEQNVLEALVSELLQTVDASDVACEVEGMVKRTKGSSNGLVMKDVVVKMVVRLMTDGLEQMKGRKTSLNIRLG